LSGAAVAAAPQQASGRSAGVRGVLETIFGLWELLRLAVRSRGRLASPYWRWRAETAFGTDPATRPGWAARARQVIRYGCWVHRMRRGC
jgi:hypothetical protein